jgi:hypothetical protein
MMVVVPAFADCEKGCDRVVARLVDGFEAAIRTGD